MFFIYSPILIGTPKFDQLEILEKMNNDYMKQSFDFWMQLNPFFKSE